VSCWLTELFARLHQDHADLHFRQAEDHVVSGDRRIGHAQQAHVAGHADAADPRDRGLGGVLQLQQVSFIDVWLRELHRERSARVLQIGADTERLFARAGQQDDAESMSSWASR
jgi:hypothetical protein